MPLRREPKLFESLLRDEWITSEARAVAAAAWEGYLHDAVVRESAGIYSFELFSKAFCETFLAEVDNYDASGLPVRRPNSMNNYGLIVNEIGMREAITELQQEILWPVARLLWPLQSTRFDAHHSFIVRYKSDEDPGLDMHTAVRNRISRRFGLAAPDSLVDLRTGTPTTATLRLMCA